MSSPTVPPARLLIVDDDRGNREVLELILSMEGFVVSTVSGGEDALASLAREPADLVLLDIMMPGMSGYEVVERMRADVATRNIPVIMVTALEDRNARTLAAKAGANAFMRKPIDRLELVAAVNGLLAGT